jgi:sulfur dioxygenase
MRLLSELDLTLTYNARIKSDTSLEAFTDTMNTLHLPYPKYIDEALPANIKLGIA